MFLVPHPETLADDWLPPLPIGREAETRELVRRLDPPSPRLPPPWIVAVAGPRGAGTSTVARRAARAVADRLRETGSPSARLLCVRVGALRGTHGVATALLRSFDDGFDGRGFPTAEVIAGFLRRLRRDGRPLVLVLDDVGLAGPELGPIVRALAAPDRFLPEGEFGLPPLWAIVAGTADGIRSALATPSDRARVEPFVALAPYDPDRLRAIVRDRALRALGREPPVSLVAGVLERAVADGGGARHAFELLRRELLGGEPSPPGGGRGARGRVLVEPHVVEAIGEASRTAPARLSEVRRWEAKLAHDAGRAPLPTTTFWRRIVRLERAGYLRREIRTGGPGGTLSVLRVLTPVDEWVTADRPETRPIFAGGTTEDPATIVPSGAERSPWGNAVAR